VDGMLSDLVAISVPSGLLKAIAEIPVFGCASDGLKGTVGKVVGCGTRE
jgi:hypothetical protein